MAADDLTRRVTASVGAMFKRESDDAAWTMPRADKALYAAKKPGARS